MPMRPTAGSAVSKSPSQARVISAEPDGGEGLVDQARQGQEPAPDDAGGDQRDDLREEQHGPGEASETPGRHAMDDRCGHQPERHGNEAEEQHQLERIDDRSEQVGVAQHGEVVRLIPTQVAGPTPFQR